jgi:hypothetical protein
MTQNNTKFARTCSDCGKGINEGYVINGGCEHYCSDACLHKHVSADEFEDLHDDGDGDSYWTEWDADDCDDDLTPDSVERRALQGLLDALVSPDCTDAELPAVFANRAGSGDIIPAIFAARAALVGAA